MTGRLDVELVNRGLVESREKGRALIMAGAVYIDGQKAFKAGDKVKLGLFAYTRKGKNNDGAVQLFSGKSTTQITNEYTIDSKGVMNVKVGSAWKEGQVYVKVNNTWKEAEAVYTKVGGSWKEST